MKNIKPMQKKNTTFTLIAALLGNMMEYFDFTVYSMFAVAIGLSFFPTYASETQLLLSFSVFAVGFLTRPLGGILFGYIGTKFSKKISLIISSCLMGFATFAIGVAPTYENLGIYSTYWLVIMRMLQGICVGGEGASVAVYILENIKFSSKGFIAGISHSSNIAGTALAAIVGIIIFDMQENPSNSIWQIFNLFSFQIESKDLWRAAFILGGTLSLISMILRLFLNNQITNLSSDIKLKNVSKPLEINFLKIIYTGFSKYYKQILIVICLSGLASSIIYMAKSYMNIIFTEKYSNFEMGSRYTLIISLMIMFFMPFCGAFNDNIDIKKIIKYCILIILCMVPSLIMIHYPAVVIECIGIFIYTLMTALIATASYLFCIKLFPKKDRFFIVSFAYNTGVAIFGGTTPMISTWLTTLTSLNYAPGFYIMFVALILIFTLNIFASITLFDIDE